MPKQQARAARVAIVGGGCAGMSAAWQLSRFPDRFDVHVFEKDSKLGGKGASTRDKQGRIIEHGLHVWLGFYENAFRMVRECYGEVEGWDKKKRRDFPLTHYSFDDAFVAEPHIGVGFAGERDARYWSGFFPPTDGTPGDPLDADSNPFTLSNYLVRCFMLLKALSQSVLGGTDADSPRGKRAKRSALDVALDRDPALDPSRTSTALIDALAERVRAGMLVGAGGLEQAFRFLELWARRLREDTGAAESALRMIEAVASQVRKQMGDMVALDAGVAAKMEVIDIVMTIAVGLYRDRVLFGERGLDALNDIDYKAWLRKHGATEAAVESQFINGIYDLTFAFHDGDRAQPSLAAGVALRGALRMFFTYRGAMFWRLRSGMGDAVFAPMYRVLSQRGVKFHFLHELRHLTVSEAHGAAVVEDMTFAIQELDPAWTPLDGAGCWPQEPAKAAAAVERTLVREGNGAGGDFDAVVLALPIESLRAVVASPRATWAAAGKGNGKRRPAAAAAPPRPLGQALPVEWQKALRYLTTAATQSAQVWMREDLDALGWKRGSAVVTALDADFQTWADMTHTLPREAAWRKKQGIKPDESRHAKSVAYLCGVVKEAPGGRQDVQQLRQDLEKTHEESIDEVFAQIFPAYARNRRAFNVLGRPHFVANLEGSGRYTLSEPGTVGYRLSPLDHAIANLAVAGDWTACGLDAGCVESAVMSGMLAAHAISGDEPALESIVGYDHP